MQMQLCTMITKKYIYIVLHLQRAFECNRNADVTNAQSRKMSASYTQHATKDRLLTDDACASASNIINPSCQQRLFLIHTVQQAAHHSTDSE